MRKFPFLFALLVLSACAAPAVVATPTATSVDSASPSTSPTLIPSRSLTPASFAGPKVAPPVLSGEFVFSPGDGSVWLQDAATGKSRNLVKGELKRFSAAPTFSPDGKQIAFTVTSSAENQDIVTSVYLIDTDGSNQREFSKPQPPVEELDWPAWSSDGTSIYAAATIPGKPSYVERTPIQGGAAVKVLDDARMAVESPDGARLAFIRFNPDNFGTSLWIANRDGSQPRNLVAEDVFASVSTPRFSPDGRWILFSVSGPPTRQLPGAMVIPRQCDLGLLCDLIAPAFADGLPWELWLVSLDGARFQQLTTVGSDSPSPAWSRDGNLIVYMDLNGLFAIDRVAMTISDLKRPGGHGAFDWWQPQP